MTSAAKTKKAKIGSLLGADLTILDIVDDGGVEPVYLVWSHRDWCPMACKAMKSAHDAQREFETLARFSHPNIVRPLGVRNERYLLMPYLEGTSLADAIDAAPKGSLAISDVMRLAIQIGAALVHIHDRGFLHMDVKPCNIMIGVDGRPLLFDFGSSRRIADARPDKVIGTNAYIAPEECLLQKASPPADIFSLGVTIFEALTGERPFATKDNGSAFAQITENGIRLRALRPRAPRELDEILAACLDRNPLRRPPLSVLLPGLHQFITRGPAALPEAALTQPKKRTRRAA